MFDIGWQELFIVAVLGIIIIGPKDLPRAVRAVRRMLRKARNLTRDFQDGLDDVIREAELDDVKEQVEKASRFDAAREIENAIDPTGDLAGDFDIGDGDRDSTAAGDQGDAAKPPAAKASR